MDRDRWTEERKKTTQMKRLNVLNFIERQYIYIHCVYVEYHIRLYCAESREEYIHIVHVEYHIRLYCAESREEYIHIVHVEYHIILYCAESH